MRRYAAYVLWDQETRNLLLDTAEEAEALTFVRRTVQTFDDSAILHSALYIATCQAQSQVALREANDAEQKWQNVSVTRYRIG